jgi:hypothetical protein
MSFQMCNVRVNLMRLNETGRKSHGRGILIALESRYCYILDRAQCHGIFSRL